MDGQRGERRVALAQLGQPLAELGEAHDLGEAADHRAVDGGIGDARQRKGEIGGDDLPGRAARLAQREAGIGVEAARPGGS